MAHSINFREKLLEYRQKHGLTIAQTARHFEVGIASITRWLKAPQRKVYTRVQHRKIDPDVLRRDIEAMPDSYQYERAARLGVKQSAIFYALKALNVTYKKSPSTPQGRRRQTAHLPR